MNKQNCFICNHKFEMGQGRYDGINIERYQICVCRTCYEGNWDGWNPRYEEKLSADLQALGLPIPESDETGLLPRD